MEPGSTPNTSSGGLRLLIAIIASIAPLSGCEHLYKFENANLPMVGAQPLVIPPTPVTRTETVPASATDTSLGTLAANIREAINQSSPFQTAGITASVPATPPDTVILEYSAADDIVWSGLATTAGGTKGSEQFHFSTATAGNTSLTLSGTATAGDRINITASTDIKDSIAAVVNQSRQACANFLGGLVLAENTSNTSLDILSTITSTLATVFHPLSTVHSLTAGTTILTGSKTAIDTDIYAKASIANFETAIRSTYYNDMSKYVSGLAAADPASLDWQIEMYKISVIHDECGLAPAEASITATLQPSQPSPAQAAGALSVTSTAAAHGATLGTLVQDIANQINASAAFKQAGVSAGSATAAGGNVTLALSYSSATPIKWSASAKTSAGGNGGEQVAFAATATGTAVTFSGTVAGGDVVTILGAPSTTPPAVTPGHSVK